MMTVYFVIAIKDHKIKSEWSSSIPHITHACKNNNMVLTALSCVS